MKIEYCTALAPICYTNTANEENTYSFVTYAVRGKEFGDVCNIYNYLMDEAKALGAVRAIFRTIPVIEHEHNWVRGELEFRFMLRAVFFDEESKPVYPNMYEKLEGQQIPVISKIGESH